MSQAHPAILRDCVLLLPSLCPYLRCLLCLHFASLCGIVILDRELQEPRVQLSVSVLSHSCYQHYSVLDITAGASAFLSLCLNPVLEGKFVHTQGHPTSYLYNGSLTGICTHTLAGPVLATLHQDSLSLLSHP